MVPTVKPIYATDAFQTIFGDILANSNKKSSRIVADHLRAAVFLLADGIEPSNKDRGYVLRRILRRLVVHSQKIGLAKSDLLSKIDAVIMMYGGTYPEIAKNETLVKDGLIKEYDKFSNTLSEGLRKFNKLFDEAKKNPDDFIKVMARNAFDLYQSSGLPLDVTFDLLEEDDFAYDRAALRGRAAELLKEHQEISKAGSTGKFGGHGLIMTGEVKAANEDEVKRVTRMHTATHLLHKALRMVLSNEVHQQGSDITPERLRFDFTYPQKMTAEQIAAVEKIVNDEIKKDLPVTVKEMPFKEALAEGSLAFFKNKYPKTVKVYSVGDFSKEVCGGPHVTHTLEIGAVKIVKEEAVSAGVRRIRAVIEP
jgi:Alanyl-tRNA synthetase